MSERLCEFERCGRKHKAKGYCSGHYWQYRQGKPIVPLMPRAGYTPRIASETTLEERLWGRVDKSTAGGCWIFTGPKLRDGYGRFSFKGKKYSAHVLAYELTIGPVQVGKDVDHMCQVKACVRPDHLRAVDASANSHNRTMPLSGSGYRNVYVVGGRWAAVIKDRGKSIYLGTFSAPELANEAVLAYRKEHGIIIDSRSELLGLDPVKI